MKKLIGTMAAALFVACIMPATSMADAYDYEYDYGWICWQPETLNAYDGIYWFGDRLETYYSSNVAYHYMTPEWWVDDEGFYRTDEGYYVIAASDYEYGSVIEGSKGLCQVLDCGCYYGISDYYVNW